MLVTRISWSLTRFIAPPGKLVFGILVSQRGGPLDRDLALKLLSKGALFPRFSFLFTMTS